MTTIENSKKTNLSWWMYLIKGVLIIVLGIWMLKMPRESFTAMLLVIGLIIAIGGVLEAFLALYYKKVLKEWGWNFSAGILDILVGILLIANPEAILVLITLFISFWLVLRGVLSIWEAMELRKEGRKNWKWVLLLGILIMLLAIVLIWHPQVIGLTIIFWIAISFISLGIFRIVLAFKLLSLPKSQ
ncbi:MAG: DUF308 domain-containing protein [Bacteroidales bacterium]|nr:DUF308 domain-containing protein [Bacteroidales bacterium]